jgi:dCMP deaminase
MSIIIAYIPALHSGYIKLFKAAHEAVHAAPATKSYEKKILYIIGNDLALTYPRMDRDIRALPAEVIQKAIEPLGFFEKVEVLDAQSLPRLLDHAATDAHTVYMPDEDFSRHFITTYAPHITPQYLSMFLRWDRTISTTEFAVQADRVISKNELDKEMMMRAKNEAAHSSDWWRQIGALAVHDQKVLLAAHNHALPGEHAHDIAGDPRSNFDAGEHFELSKFIHAEAALIAEAAKKGIALDGATLYVTTFPCPVCAKSVASAGFTKVVYEKGYSLLDAEDILKKAGVEVVLVQP